MTEKTVPILSVQNVSKFFPKGKKQELTVLEDIDFELYEGELVSILGRSGCGKSTMLRIIAGLIPPSKGKIFFRGKILQEPCSSISMIFQNFALLPWLNVLQNVEIGLEARRINGKIRRKRALTAIDRVGLDGFETAYPKELSGGMRQRVAFARSLVLAPDLLLMDEPFSALDVLSADNLRNDLADLWGENRSSNIGCALLVTHNIEEAIYLSNRAIILDSNPGKIKDILKINLPWPRDYQDTGFRLLVDEVYNIMTSPQTGRLTPKTSGKIHDIYYRLPSVDVSELIGLLENIVELQGDQKTLDLPFIANELASDIDELLSLTEVLSLLGFAEEAHGDITISGIGKEFVAASIQTRKKLFAQQILAHIPLIGFILQELKRVSIHRLDKRYFIAKLNTEFSLSDSERLVKTMIQWGRYAELFAYDDQTNELNLEDPQ